MDMRALLEAMNKFSGEASGQKPGDQVRGTEKAKKGKDHPFKGRLVGGESQEPQSNMLGELDQIAKDTMLERSLAERWAAFKEEAFKDTAEKRPSRPGSRPDRGHQPKPSYKKIKETDTNPLAADPAEIRKAMAATSQLKSVTGTTAPAPNLAKALDAASQGKPIDATNAKVLEPMMDIVSKAATDPKLANQFKTLAQQAKTVK